MKTIAPDERLVYRFEGEGRQVWLYHCGTAPLSPHSLQGHAWRGHYRPGGP